MLGFLLLSICGFAQASLFNHHEALGMACALAAQDLFTSCNKEDYDCFCGSNLFIYAVETCIGREARYNSTLMGMSFDRFETKFCEAHGVRANTMDVWSSENQNANPIVSEKAFMLAYQGERDNMAQKEEALWLGTGLVLYWAAICALVLATRLMSRIIIRLFAHRVVMRRATWLERWLQRKVFWPAIFNAKHMSRYEFFRGWVIFSLPTRFESLVVSVYILLNVIFMLTPYTFMNNDPLFQTRWKEMMRYASDRAGIIATVQFPMLVLFALRNNILLWLTGWSYATFNTYHRAVARVTYAQLIVHAVMKHIFSASYGGSLSKYYYPVPYFRWGVAAMGLFALMIASAVFRGRGYEVFYRLHQALAIGGLICSIFHLDTIGFKTPLWIAIALWGTDWLLRVCRILLFNINFIMPPLPGAYRSSFATARLYDGELIKLSITTPVRWICSPGQYIFLHSSQWSFIGGHPFSVVGSNHCGEGLEIVIKARTGMTRKLCAALDDRSCAPQYPVTIPVYVEGPYGHGAPVRYYDEGLFFAGGIGITGVLGYVEEMVKHNRLDDVPKKIRFFWAISSRHEIEPFADRLRALLRKDGVQIRIFQRKGVILKPEATLKGGIVTEFNSDGVSGSNLDSSHNFMVSVDLATSGSDELSVVGGSDEVHMGHPVANDGAPFSRRTQQRASSKAVDSLVKKKYPRNRSRDLGLDDASSGEYSAEREQSGHKRTRSRFNRRSFQEHLKRPSEIRHSIADFVKARNPEDNDTFDYGKEGILEGHTKQKSTDSRFSFEKTHVSKISNPSMAPSTEAPNAGPHRRPHLSRLLDAGLTDPFAERRISMLNPFDDDVYPHTSTTLTKPDAVMSDTEKTPAIEEVYECIEAVGMDVASLIMHHFKHSDGSICVVGCGPDRMMDTLCWSACEFLETAKNGRVDYYEEAFKW